MSSIMLNQNYDLITCYFYTNGPALYGPTINNIVKYMRTFTTLFILTRSAPQYTYYQYYGHISDTSSRLKMSNTEIEFNKFNTP